MIGQNFCILWIQNHIEIPLHYYINCMQHKHELNPYNLHSIKSYWKNFLLPAFQRNLTMIITGFLNEIIFMAKHVWALELLHCSWCRSYKSHSKNLETSRFPIVHISIYLLRITLGCCLLNWAISGIYICALLFNTEEIQLEKTYSIEYICAFILYLYV